MEGEEEVCDLVFLAVGLTDMLWLGDSGGVATPPNSSPVCIEPH